MAAPKGCECRLKFSEYMIRLVFSSMPLLANPGAQFPYLERFYESWDNYPAHVLGLRQRLRSGGFFNLFQELLEYVKTRCYDDVMHLRMW